MKIKHFKYLPTFLFKNSLKFVKNNSKNVTTSCNKDLFFCLIYFCLFVLLIDRKECNINNNTCRMSGYFKCQSQCVDEDCTLLYCLPDGQIDGVVDNLRKLEINLVKFLKKSKI